jgi:cytochrome c
VISRGRIWAIGTFWISLALGWPAQASELVDLAKIGDIAGVSSVLDGGTAVDELAGGVSALYVACEQGNLELARLLISRGADVNLLVRLQRTPLYGAIKGAYADIVELLLDSGADPNKLTKLQTPLHIAAQDGCLPCVIELVEAGAEVNALTSSGNPAIHFAKREGHEETASYLLDHGAGAPTIAPISPLLASAEAESGKQVFEKMCVKCHIATSEPETSKRPNLWGIVGRPKAAEGDVDYSSLLKNAGGTWTFEELNTFVAHPTVILPGTTMEFVGLQGEKERADLIEYLRTLSDAPVPLPAN